MDRNITTRYWWLAQKIPFPMKSWWRAQAQKGVARQWQWQLAGQVLAVRQQVIGHYYGIYCLQKIIHLIEANMQIMKDFARIAGQKYAAGTTSQGDSMRAHLELTRMELEAIKLRQEERMLREQLLALIGKGAVVAGTGMGSVKVPAALPTPKARLGQIPASRQQLLQLLRQKSPYWRSHSQQVQTARSQRSEAQWQFAPDIEVKYQEHLSGKPDDSKSWSVGLTLPLWIWGPHSKLRAAQGRENSSRQQLVEVSRQLIASVNSLRGEVFSGGKALQIYNRGLLQQARSSYNSMRAAYRANKVSFLHLLDSERALHSAQVGFYQELRQYIENLLQLETQIGFRISNLPEVKS